MIKGSTKFEEGNLAYLFFKNRITLAFLSLAICRYNLYLTLLRLQLAFDSYISQMLEASLFFFPHFAASAVTRLGAFSPRSMIKEGLIRF